MRSGRGSGPQAGPRLLPALLAPALRSAGLTHWPCGSPVTPRRITVDGPAAGGPQRAGGRSANRRQTAPPIFGRQLPHCLALSFQAVAACNWRGERVGRDPLAPRSGVPTRTVRKPRSASSLKTRRNRSSSRRYAQPLVIALGSDDDQRRCRHRQLQRGGGIALVTQRRRWRTAEGRSQDRVTPADTRSASRQTPIPDLVRALRTMRFSAARAGSNRRKAPLTASPRTVKSVPTHVSTALRRAARSLRGLRQ